MYEAEPGESAEPDPAGPDRDERGRGQQHDRPGPSMPEPRKRFRHSGNRFRTLTDLGRNACGDRFIWTVRGRISGTVGNLLQPACPCCVRWVETGLPECV